MVAFFKSHPGVILALCIACVAIGISHQMSFLPQGEKFHWGPMISLGALVFFSLFLGIVSFWWHALKQIQPRPKDDGLDESLRFDLSDIIFSPDAAISMLERNLAKIKERWATLERITHLLSFINYSIDIPRQLKVALSLAHEIFPGFSILVFLKDRRGMKFEIGSKSNLGGRMTPLDAADPLIEEVSAFLKREIDLEALSSAEWKSFNLPPKSGSAVFSIPVLPLQVWNNILGLVVYLPPGNRPLDQNERVLAALFNPHIAVFLENHLLFQEKVSQARLVHEVEIAKKVQMESLPASSPPLSGYDIYGLCSPCYEISGDYFDLVPLSGDRLLVTLADVSGKGLPAALFLSKIQTLVRAMADRFDSPGALLSFLSQQLAKEQMGGLFATMLSAIFTANSTEITLASAGHCKPMVLRTRTGFVEEISFEVGIPLGLFPDKETDYVDQKVDLIPGDGIFFYSDGLTDIFDSQRRRLGTEGLRQILEKGMSKKSQELVYQVIGEMNRFKKATSHEDDITMVFCRSEPVQK